MTAQPEKTGTGKGPPCKNFPCMFQGCTKTYQRKCGLTQHTKTAHDDNYKAPMKPMTSMSRTLPAVILAKSLNSSSSTATRPVPTNWACPYPPCTREYVQKCSLYKHLKAQHPEHDSRGRYQQPKLNCSYPCPQFRPTPLSLIMYPNPNNNPYPNPNPNHKPSRVIPNHVHVSPNVKVMIRVKVKVMIRG